MDNKAKEIVKELKEYTYWLGSDKPYSHICDRAADLIEDQAEEIRRLTNANDQLDSAVDSLMRSNKALADEVQRLEAELLDAAVAEIPPRLLDMRELR